MNLVIRNLIKSIKDTQGQLINLNEFPLHSNQCRRRITKIMKNSMSSTLLGHLFDEPKNGYSKKDYFELFKLLFLIYSNKNIKLLNLSKIIISMKNEIEVNHNTVYDIAIMIQNILLNVLNNIIENENVEIFEQYSVDENQLIINNEIVLKGESRRYMITWYLKNTIENFPTQKKSARF